ncbi:hypothetical protein [Chryseolinea lacunae]|uniref:Dialkylrecorsinol condensing enzyme n=1 Tax=Chryseolinea lacunae TaxID=2801331 RepID=A0ABS1KND4_9BACT|nr:hypothetical protein [Chryseolinea lacunae]MBL0740855.1 hypothetical protein [Chryseolinea lacunae]
MKKILILYFTQSGQSLNILQTMAKPFIRAGHRVHFEEIQPVEKFPFPWSAFDFFNAFPETFGQKPMTLKSLSAQAFEAYDLVILGYQPWFLTPSRPVSSFLQSDDAKRVLKQRDVVTILGCRNMWLGAQEKMKRRLLENEGRLRGHIALVDRMGNLTSLITILRWMFTGNRKPFWFFPAAGVTEADVQHSETFGELINHALEKENYDTLQTELNKEGAIEIKSNLVLMERRGQKAFSVWSKFIASGGSVQSTGRKIRVYIFMYLLPTAIFFLSPLLWLLSKIQLTVKRKELLEDVEYYKQNSLRQSR